MSPIASWLVTKDLVKFFHMAICQLLNDANSLQVVFDLVFLCRTEQNTAHIRILCAPSQCQFDDCAVQFVFGIRGEFLDLVKFPFLFPRLDDIFNPRVSLLRRSRPFRKFSVVVLSRQKTTGQRTPRRQSKSIRRLVHWKIFLFDTITMKHVVLGLFDLGRLQSLRLGNPTSLGDLLCTPLAGSPRHGLILTNDIRHGANHIFRRRQAVGTMTVHNVHVVKLQPFQRGVHPFHNVLATQSTFVQSAASPKQLGRDQHIRTSPKRPVFVFEFLVGLSKNTFRFSYGVAVRFGVVKKVDSTLSGNGQNLFGVVNSFSFK
mmetsp:Transcript_24146/g.39426  ORF Transcript_24146/g.39426 Transcript_24146/m.39426 type:complete len:317 (+) Transcript_24146:176-1126(+)